MVISSLSNALFVGFDNGAIEMYSPLPNQGQALGVWRKLQDENSHSNVRSMICNDDMTQKTTSLYIGQSNRAVTGFTLYSSGQPQKL